MSKSPSASSSAFLQSIIPAPVASRSFFTSAALTAIVVTRFRRARDSLGSSASGARVGSCGGCGGSVVGSGGGCGSGSAAGPRSAAAAAGAAAPRAARAPSRRAARRRRAGRAPASRRSRPLPARAISPSATASAIDAGQQSRPNGSRRRCPGSGSRRRRGRSWCRGSRRPGCPACGPRATAMCSFLVSTTQTALGHLGHVADAAEGALELLRSRDRTQRFLLGASRCVPPVASMTSSSLSRCSRLWTVEKLVSMPPSQRWLT